MFHIFNYISVMYAVLSHDFQEGIPADSDFWPLFQNSAFQMHVMQLVLQLIYMI